MFASWATTKQCLNCIERRHFITLASDCLLICSDLITCIEWLLKKMVFMFLFQHGAQYFSIYLLMLFSSVIFGGIIIFCFLASCFPKRLLLLIQILISVVMMIEIQ